MAQVSRNVVESIPRLPRTCARQAFFLKNKKQKKRVILSSGSFWGSLLWFRERDDSSLPWVQTNGGGRNQFNGGVSGVVVVFFFIFFPFSFFKLGPGDWIEHCKSVAKAIQTSRGQNFPHPRHLYLGQGCLWPKPEPLWGPPPQSKLGGCVVHQRFCPLRFLNFSPLSPPPQ